MYQNADMSDSAGELICFIHQNCYKYWVLHSFGLVPHLSKKLSNLLLVICIKHPENHPPYL